MVTYYAVCPRRAFLSIKKGLKGIVCDFMFKKRTKRTYTLWVLSVLSALHIFTKKGLKGTTRCERSPC